MASLSQKGVDKIHMFHIVIYQQLPVYSLYFTTPILHPSLQFILRLFTTSSSTDFYSQCFCLSSHLIFQKVFQKISTLLKRFLSPTYRWRIILLVIRLSFKVDFWFHYYVLWGWCWPCGWKFTPANNIIFYLDFYIFLVGFVVVDLYSF